MAYYKKFNKKSYKEHLSVGKKSIANSEKNKLKRQGWNVRVYSKKDTRMLGGKKYVLYKRFPQKR